MAKKEKEAVAVPTEAEIPALCDRLAEIKKLQASLKEEAAGIEARLEAYGLAQPEQHAPLTEEKREGRRVVLRGVRSAVRVVFSSDLLVGSFRDNSPKHSALLGVLAKVDGDKTPDELLKLFFEAPCKWENRFSDGQRFRQAAAEWLGDVAPAFLVECRQADKYGVAKNKTTVEVDGKEEAAR